MNLLITTTRTNVQLPKETWMGKCLQANVVYQASVTTEATNESYVGLATNFKDRYRNHMTSFRHANRRNETELSKYIWTLKDARKPFRVQWKVLATCKPYDNVSKKCNLCLKENFFIICWNDLCTLNKRNELASSCPLILPDECGHLLTIRNRSVAIKRWITSEAWNYINCIIVTAPEMLSALEIFFY